MTLERWLPRTDYSRREQILRRRLTRTGKLFGFLRDCRRELWWSSMFATSRFWRSLRGRFVPAVDVAMMPASLLSRMLPTDEPAVVALLRLLSPVSTRPWLQASAM